MSSPDGSSSVYAKPASGSAKPTLWMEGNTGSPARLLLDVATARVQSVSQGTPLADVSGITDLAFSPDGKSVYFQTDGWATSLALYAVDVTSGDVRFVRDANGYFVINKCKDAAHIGRLVIYQHSYFDVLPQSAVDWYFLIEPTGDRVGIVGPEPQNVARFLADRCGVGSPVPAPPPLRIPARLRKRFECQGMRYDYQPIKLLDGTALDFFRLRMMPSDPEDADQVVDASSVVDSVTEACPQLVGP